MDFNQLKELARKLGGILVVNGNTPEFVVLTYEDFERLQSGKAEKAPGHNLTAPEEDGNAIERLNKEILALKEEIRQKEEAELETDEETGGSAEAEARENQNI